jgi:hypothetical protein
MIEVTSDYAAHFFDMYVKNHDGKHMTGDRIKIPLLNLPFMLRDLILPEVMCIHRGASPCTLHAHYAHYAHFSKLASPPKIKL